MKLRRFGLVAAVSTCLATLSVQAQEGSNLMVVLDGSGSMWGQIGGRTKIELAREALSGVLSEASQEMQIGLMAYGHRQKGQCGDIQTLVPMGPASRTVPRILEEAYSLKPKGMTPIVDSVMAAAEELGFTEQAATVVLLTDGIETCGGDPCALGRMLAAKGIDFTAHVVGFDMTDAEQRQLACLATETGGMFLAAADADGLGRALRDTILAGNEGPVVEFIPPPMPEPEPVVAPRMVEFYLRDTVGGEVLTGRALQGVDFLALDEGGVVPPAVALRLGDKPWTLDGDFLPGLYEIQIARAGNRGTVIRAALQFEVPEGTGPHQVDLVIAARLRLTAMAHAGLPMPDRLGNLPFATYGSDSGRALFQIHPIIGGAIDPSVDYGGVNSLDIALPPGDYFIRGTLAKTFARERLVRVPTGEVLDYTFDFEAGRVFVDLRDGAGLSSTRQTVRFFDRDAKRYFMYGGGERGANWNPFYLPRGSWRITVQNETGAKERAEAVVSVIAPGADVLAELQGGVGLTDAARAQMLDEGNRGCLALGPGSGICFVEVVTPAIMARDLPSGVSSAGLLAPRYTGTWDMGGTMLTLVQDGRRVWGDVHGGTVRRLYGEVAADGLTLRGTMTGIGIFEFRLAPDGLGFTGGSAHFGGGETGTRVAETLVNARYEARKLSAAAPPLVMADGTEADLHPAFQNRAVPAFEAFMAPVRTPAPAGAEGDLDRMQAQALWVSFGGTWDSSSRVLHLHQDHRRIWGERDNGVLEGELSPDGQTLRGTWSNTDGKWGLLEFALSDDLQAFEGRWGHALDTELKGGKWTGTRSTWLASQPLRATGTPSDRPAGATGAVFDAFMEAVRGPDLAPQPGPVDFPSPGPVAGGKGFDPILRYDYTHADGRLAVSFVFGEAVEGAETYGHYNPGFALMHPGWCGGTDCPEAEIFPVGGPTIDEVPNAMERLEKGGVFPALDLFSQGIAVFRGDDSAWPELGVHVHILSEPFSDDRQLGRGGDLIEKSYGPFTGGLVRPATMAGFGALPWMGDAQPMPAPGPQPGPELGPEPGPMIGSIERLPRGVFAALDVEPGQTEQEAMASLLVAPLDMMVQAQCSTRPTVIHDDGLIAERDLRIGQRADIAALFETSAYRLCAQSGPLLFCDEVFGPLGPAPRSPDRSFRAEVMIGPQGTFAIASLDPAVPSRAYRSCLAPVDLAGSGEPAGDGRTRLQHMLDREDRPQRVDAGDPVQGGAGAGGGASAGAGGTLDFARLQGLWAEAFAGDPALACLRSPILIRDDGGLGVWGGDASGNQSLLASLSCQPSGQCEVLTTNIPRDRWPAGLELVARGGGLGLCADGNCMELASCPMAAIQAGLEERISRAMDAEVAGAARAEVPSLQLPPGIWLTDFEPEGYGLRPGTPEFLAACYEFPTIAYPDGTTITLELRDEAAGPAYSVVYAESCAPSGDATWPLTCESEDASVADPAAAMVRLPTQLFARSAGLYRQVSNYGGGDTAEFLWHDCQRGDGARIDLTADPLGPLLERTARELRSGGAAPVPGPQPMPAPQPTNDPMPAPEPAPVLIAEIPAARLHTGIWVSGFEGDAQFPAPGSAAFRELCYENPVVVAPDGTTTGYMLQQDTAGPVYVLTGTESCQPSGDLTWPLVCDLVDAFVADPSAATLRARGHLYSREDGSYRSLREFSDGLREDLIWQACTRGDGRGIDLAADPMGPLLSQVAAGGQGAAPVPTPDPMPDPMPDPVQGGQLAPPPDMRLALNGLWFPRLDGRPLAAWSAAERQEACRKTPGFMHADGLFIAFETHPGDYIPSANAHLRCGDDLSCAFHPGAPSAGQGATLVGNIELLSDGDARICLDGLCFGLSRCAMPDWTAAERGIGLDREWEARVTGRN